LSSPSQSKSQRLQECATSAFGFVPMQAASVAASRPHPKRHAWCSLKQPQRARPSCAAPCTQSTFQRSHVRTQARSPLVRTCSLGGGRVSVHARKPRQSTNEAVLRIRASVVAHFAPIDILPFFTSSSSKFASQIHRPAGLRRDLFHFLSPLPPSLFHQASPSARRGIASANRGLRLSPIDDASSRCRAGAAPEQQKTSRIAGCK
jgi:hypothetical protein